MTNKMGYNRRNISSRYLELIPQYNRLGINLQQSLETFLKEEGIPYLSINYRIKDVESFIEKIDRKKYENPFDDIEDTCGLRIICYYQSDIEKIKQIVEKEFEIFENQDKIELLHVNEFGYRSMHFIAKIKKEWTNAPNFRGLENLKAEIQVRTILMHSWAEIEHKLSYKSENHIPKDLIRKFSRISAKLEEADEQFEEIRNSIETNRLMLVEKAIETKSFDINAELNVDNLQAFLDFAFPERDKSISGASNLIDEMYVNEISFKDLILGYEEYKDKLDEIEDEENDFCGRSVSDRYSWAQEGAARTIFELISDRYFHSRETPLNEFMEKWRQK